MLKEEEDLIRKGLKVVEGLDHFDNIVVYCKLLRMGDYFKDYCEIFIYI